MSMANPVSGASVETLFHLRPQARSAAVARVDYAASAARSVHPGAIALGLAGFALFLTASLAGWAVGETAVPIAVIVVLATLYFGMMTGLGAYAERFRGGAAGRSFRAFLAGRTAVLTGTVTGTEALVQIALLPLLLGLLMSYLAVLWAVVG